MMVVTITVLHAQCSDVEIKASLQVLCRYDKMVDILNPHNDAFFVNSVVCILRRQTKE